MSELLDVANKKKHAARRRVMPAPIQTMRLHTDKVSVVAFLNDGQRVVTGSWDYTLRICDIQKGTVVGGSFVGHSNKVFSVAVSPDDRQIASGGKDNNIIIWDVESRRLLFDPLTKHTNWVSSVCFSLDGKRLASGSYDSTVIIWDAETGAVLSTLQGDRGGVSSVAFNPDGSKLASGSLRSIQVWRTDNAELIFEINAHEKWVLSVVWSPDGQQLVSASYDKTVKFWDSSKGHQIGQPCTSHTSNINSLAISSDGSFIATVSDDRTVQNWSTKSHQKIGEPLKHIVDVTCVSISPDAELVAVGDLYGEIQLWSIKNTLSAAVQLYSLSDSYFAHRSKVKLKRNLYHEALSDAQKVIELNPSSYLGYKLKHAALYEVRRYDDAIESFKIMLSKLDNALDSQIRQLRQQYVSPSEVEDAIRQAVHAHLENAPLRLIHTITGKLCDRQAQINTFKTSMEYKEILSSSMLHRHLQTEPIREAVVKYFSWVMLSHRWETKEPRLHEIQDKDVYTLRPVGTIVKLQKFCKIARDAGYSWAWSDTCCIDQNNNVEVQASVNSMFVWYHNSALTIIYLSDVSPSSKCTLAKSVWNTRGWTVQEFLAPTIVLFYQADWTLYLHDHSLNHKESVSIMEELERSTGINAQALVAFSPGMRNAREKLQWASCRVTTLQEDIAYSLFGIFGIHLPVIYGEKKQNALGRLLQEIIAHSGDITALDWVGQSSSFNSCLPANIASYRAPSCTLPSLSEDEIQASVSSLRNNVAQESALKLYTTLDNLSAPRFANCRLRLPCITFPLTKVKRSAGTPCTYHIKADGLQDLEITTADTLVQFWPGKPTSQKFLLIRPWNRHDLGLPDFADEMHSADDGPEPGSPSDDPLGLSPLDNEPAGLRSLTREPSLLIRLTQQLGALWLGQQEQADSRSHTRELGLVVRLGQPFTALLLAQQRGGEYKRIASECNIIAQVRDMACVDDMMNVRTLEIL
ncbi:WD40-repeat-containing domain protein [Suillus discolor]|uniref:WD40-repeat-containing domain protein n=1 Tax=Suillus discolor TaxID=1912936 RepID=A0A9P7JLR1_9AGAM|nr:WD40-repeat-containing domain protein [Suillus discolor]KAG2087183.1 WD40-repeat-containing domain protein [Suillus discolor]